MNWSWFRRPNISDHASAMAHKRYASERERIRAKTRQMREELHLAPRESLR